MEAHGGFRAPGPRLACPLSLTFWELDSGREVARHCPCTPTWQVPVFLSGLVEGEGEKREASGLSPGETAALA